MSPRLAVLLATRLTRHSRRGGARRPNRRLAARSASNSRPRRTARARTGTGLGAPQARLRAGFIVVAIVLSIFATRLVQLQGIDPRQYAQMAAQEGEVSVVLPAKRGAILDRNGKPLATSVAGLMVAADPEKTRAKAPELATFLARHLGVDYFTTLERLQADGSRFEYIARQVPAARATRVVDQATERGFGGLFTRSDPVRIYPAHQIAATVVGFLGARDDETGAAQSEAGLEDAFNNFLAGHDGEARYQTSAGERIPLGDATVDPARDGNNLVTTIDTDLQWNVQRVLRQTVVNSGAESGVAIVMDSHTGELLTLADYPSYDPADPKEDDGRYASRAVTDVYEPGSVEKVLTMAGLIDAGYVTNRTKFKVPGELDRDGKVIHDWWTHDTINLTLAGIVAQSSNIGTVIAADRFKPGELRSYLTGFGFGTSTGIGLNGEGKGIVPVGAAWTPLVDDRIAFGQSLSVTALQMVSAVNTIANDGVRIDPSIVHGVATTNKGTQVGSGVATTERVVSEEAANQVTAMMERVVDPDVGAGPQGAVPGYRVAGKTGTAQRVSPDGVGYDGSYTVSFGGFAPADDPKFTVYVVVQNPKTGGGGSVAGPAFSQIMQIALNRYGVAPTQTRPSKIPVEW